MMRVRRDLAVRKALRSLDLVEPPVVVSSGEELVAVAIPSTHPQFKRIARLLGLGPDLALSADVRRFLAEECLVVTAPATGYVRIHLDVLHDCFLAWAKIVGLEGCGLDEFARALARFGFAAERGWVVGLILKAEILPDHLREVS